MQGENKFGLFLGLSIAELLCCCPLTGIIGIVLSAMANSAYNMGDWNGYNSKIKGAKIALIVGLVLFVIGTIVGLASGILASFIEASSYSIVLF